MTDERFIELPPHADATTETLRGLGYTAETAIADVIDNSISAGATTIDVNVGYVKNTSAYVTVTDNGDGMNETELRQAMSIGWINPRVERKKHDLGRFGIGMKTAAFSQGRLLTVVSTKGGKSHSMYWDLDRLNTGKWYVGIGVPNEAKLVVEEARAFASQKHGTMVIWQKLDRMVPEKSNKDYLIEQLRKIKAHLGMVFHRFLQDSDFVLTLNGNIIKPWDPYLEGHPGKIMTKRPQPVPTLLRPEAMVSVNILPCRERMTVKEFEDAAGPYGWAQHQGFFVYRNKRLLVPGGWLGLGRKRSWLKDEAHRQVRIQLDITNDRDSEWQVDIRKASVVPPPQLRQQLLMFAEDAREMAVRAFTGHRVRHVKNAADGESISIWECVRTNTRTIYRINREEPFVSTLMKDVNKKTSRSLEILFKLIEDTLPVEKIFVQGAAERDMPANQMIQEKATETLNLLNELWSNLKARYGADVARGILSKMEIFNNYSEEIMGLR